MKSHKKYSTRRGVSKQHDHGSLVQVQAGGSAAQYRRLQGSEAAAAVCFFEGETTASSTPEHEGADLDLDTFFQRVYRFYADKGFRVLTIRWVAELVVAGFTIAFSGFLVLFVDWPRLLTATCDPRCDLAKVALREHPLRPFTLGRLFFVCYLALLLLYWCLCFARFFYQLRGNLEIRHFVHTRLGISEKELQRMSWPSLVDKIVHWQQQRDAQGCRVRPRLSAHDIVSRVMRKENYLIGMLNKGVLALDRPSGGRARPVVLTKAVEWSLDWCIFQCMFDSNFMIRADFASEPARLRRRLKVLGVAMLLLSPFSLLFALFYFVLWNVESFYRNPAARGLRSWSNWASWSFREFNELEHMFKQRLSASYEPALEYVKQFSPHATSTAAKVVSYIAGAFVALILVLYVIDPVLLEGHIGRHDLLWYEFLFGAILACSRALIADDSGGQPFNPTAIMRRVSLHTHHMPKHWRAPANVEIVRSEFQKMFKLKAILFLEEILSILVAPYILIFELPECVDGVLQFVQDFTVHVEGVGHVCSLSVFNFEQHGNSKYGSPFNTSKHRRSSQGKMEKSFISFKTNYPNWEPNGDGKQLMSTLESSWRLQSCNEENQGRVGPGIPGNNPRRPSFSAAGNLRERNLVHVIEMPSSVNGPEYSYLRRPENDAAEQIMDLLDKFYTLASAQSPPEQNHLVIASDGSFTFAGSSDTISRASGTSVRDVQTQDAAQAESTGTRWWDRAQDSRGSAAGQSFLDPPASLGHDPINLPDRLSSSDTTEGSGDEATWAPSQRGSDPRESPAPHQNLLVAQNNGPVNLHESQVSCAFTGGAHGYRPHLMRAWLLAQRHAAEASSQVLQQEEKQDGDGDDSVLEFPFGDAFDVRTRACESKLP